MIAVGHVDLGLHRGVVGEDGDDDVASGARAGSEGPPFGTTIEATEM